MPVGIGRRFMLGVSAAAAFAASLDIRLARADADPAIIQPIQGLYDALLTVMKEGTKTPFGQRFNSLAPAVDRALDMATILEVSVGSMWSTLSPDQHEALYEAFRSYTINSYLSNFNSYTGQRFVIEPNLRAVGAEQVVQTKIVPASGDPHALDYVMRQTGAGWKAVDVLADGTISRVATQRSDFRSLVMRGGGDMLLASLKKKAADLATQAGA